jgi:hypothetical protein
VRALPARREPAASLRSGDVSRHRETRCMKGSCAAAEGPFEGPALEQGRLAVGGGPFLCEQSSSSRPHGRSLCRHRPIRRWTRQPGGRPARPQPANAGAGPGDAGPPRIMGAAPLACTHGASALRERPMRWPVRAARSRDTERAVHRSGSRVTGWSDGPGSRPLVPASMTVGGPVRFVGGCGRAATIRAACREPGAVRAVELVRATAGLQASRSNPRARRLTFAQRPRSPTRARSRFRGQCGPALPRSSGGCAPGSASRCSAGSASGLSRHQARWRNLESRF